MKTVVELGNPNKSEVPYHKLDPRGSQYLASDSFLVLDDHRNLVGSVGSPRKRCCSIPRLICLTLLVLAVVGIASVAFVLVRAHVITVKLPTASLWMSKAAAAANLTAAAVPLSSKKEDVLSWKSAHFNQLPLVHPSLPPLPPNPGSKDIMVGGGEGKRKCPSVDLFRCDGFSHADSMDALKAHQFRIDEALAEELLEEADKLPLFYDLPMAHDVRMAFKKCIAQDSRRNKSAQVVETIVNVEEKFGFQSSFFRKSGSQSRFHQPKAFSSAKFAQLVAHLQTTMGMSTIFHMDVQASDTLKEPFAIYLKINHEKMRHSEFIAEFIRRNSPGANVNMVLKGIDELKSRCALTTHPKEYEKWTLSSINRRWSELDFPEYFRSLAKDSDVPAELAEILESSRLEFFIENSGCFSALNALLRGAGSFQPSRSLPSSFDRHKYVSDLMAYLMLAEQSEFLGGYDFDESLELAEQAFPFSEVPYRLECVAELRQHLPLFMGRMYSEVIEHRHGYNENITDLKSSFHTYYRSLIQSFLKYVNNAHGSKKSLALEKLRNIGITLGAPDWLNDRKRMQDAHMGLKLGSSAKDDYLSIQMQLKSFTFRQKLLRLVEEDEYNIRRPFDKICSANVEMRYSRPGNWLQVPLGVLTLPLLKLDKVASFKYNNLFKYSTVGRMVGSELSKAIDSDGKWWFSTGFFRSVDKFGPAFSLQTTEDCYRNQLLSSEYEEDENTDEMVHRALNDVMGISVSMQQLQEQYEKEVVGGGARLLQERFVHELQPYYCMLGHSNNQVGANERQLVLKHFLTSLAAKEGLLGCPKAKSPAQCELRFEEDLDDLPDGALYQHGGE